jgi:hypothetical protein
MPPGHWLPNFNFNVEEWFEGDRYETLAICRTLELAPSSPIPSRPRAAPPAPPDS